MRAARPSRRVASALATLTASMRVRLTLWYLAILALVFLIFNVVLIGELRQNDEAAQHALLAKIAQQAASSYNPSDGLLDVESLTSGKVNATTIKPVVGQVSLLPASAVALFVDPQGAVIQSVGPLSAKGIAALQASLINTVTASGRGTIAHAADLYAPVALPIDSPKSAEKSADYVVYSTDVVSQGRLVGTLMIGLPNAINQTTTAVLPALLLAGPVTLLVAALGGYWLASRALRPVRLITRAAQQISETDLSRRLRLRSRDELGELAATFDHMLGRLEAAFQRQRQFTADASHELRTPLTIINLEVTRALATRRTPEEYERALAVIQAENLAMSRLVGDLLTLARADAGRREARLELVDLSDVALDAVERLAALAQQRGVRLVVEALPEITLRGDRAALAQALLNLVENGVKYTAGVGSRVTVTTVHACADGRAWAVARVADDGPGIAPEHLPYLFDRFYRVDVARTAEMEEDGAARDGSGLGLAIAQWAAQAHGGELRVQSAVGAGSTFELWLPAVESDRAANVVDAVDAVDAGTKTPPAVVAEGEGVSKTKW